VVEIPRPRLSFPVDIRQLPLDNGVGNTPTVGMRKVITARASTGLPHAGSNLHQSKSSNHSYTMAPSYKTNDAVLLDSTLTTATLTLVFSTACSQLSFLEAAATTASLSITPSITKTRH